MENYIIHSETYKGFTINIFQDYYPLSPREWDNLGTMICFHKRYTLGDETELSKEDFNSWDEVKKELEKQGAKVILPLYLYDHSGLTISTTPFSCRWDSGQVGFIYVTAEKLRKEYNVKKITKEIIRKATEVIIQEVNDYDYYLRGEVYGYSIENKLGEIVEACGGYIGEQDRVEEEAKYMADYLHKKVLNSWYQKLKELIKNSAPLASRLNIKSNYIL